MEVKHDMNVVVLGNSKVGKSSLVQQFTQRTCSDNYMPTMGVDYETAIIQVKKTEKWVKLV